MRRTVDFSTWTAPFSAPAARSNVGALRCSHYHSDTARYLAHSRSLGEKERGQSRGGIRQQFSTITRHELMP